MPKSDSKAVKNLPIMDKITIQVAGQPYEVKTPFSFDFWVWFFENCEIPTDTKDNDAFQVNLIKSIPSIIARLTGLDTNEILNKQTEKEFIEAQVAILKQLTEEFKSSPFVKKAALIGAQIQIMRRQTGGKL